MTASMGPGVPAVPGPYEAAWFMVGLTTGEHLQATLHGSFADGYDAGYADGVHAGRQQLEAELAAQHAAVWAEVGPRVQGWPMTVHNRAAADERWAARFDGVVWDPAAEVARCRADWEVGS